MGIALPPEEIMKVSPTQVLSKERKSTVTKSEILLCNFTIFYKQKLLKHTKSKENT